MLNFTTRQATTYYRTRQDVRQLHDAYPLMLIRCALQTITSWTFYAWRKLT